MSCGRLFSGGCGSGVKLRVSGRDTIAEWYDIFLWHHKCPFRGAGIGQCLCELRISPCKSAFTLFAKGKPVFIVP